MVYSVVEQKAKMFSARYRWQAIATMTVHIMTLVHGVGVGWLAPSLFFLASDQSPLSKPINIEEISWVGSLIGLGALAGNLTFGLLLDLIGRKLCMYFLAIPNMMYWILIYVATDVSYLYAGRFLAGISGGGCYVVLPIFVAEISDTNIRGSLSSMVMMYVSVGIIIGYILSSYLNYYIMPCVAILLPIAYMFAIIRFPETPQYLLRKGRNEQAKKSYCFYKNLKFTQPNSESANVDTENEFATFKEQVLSGGVQHNVGWKDFSNRMTMKIFGLSFTLVICNQLSGSFALFNYTSHIFAELHCQIPTNICIITVGASQVVGIICTVVLVDRVGRRRLLLISMTGMGLGELSIGLLDQFASKEFLTETNWLALLLMSFVAFIASLGIIPLVFLVIIELLPAKIRSIGTSICMATLSIFIFVSLKIYPLMIFDHGLAITMFVSTSVCCIGLIIFGLFLPETKGKLLTN